MERQLPSREKAVKVAIPLLLAGVAAYCAWDRLKASARTCAAWLAPNTFGKEEGPEDIDVAQTRDFLAERGYLPIHFTDRFALYWRTAGDGPLAFALEEVHPWWSTLWHFEEEAGTWRETRMSIVPRGEEKTVPIDSNDNLESLQHWVRGLKPLPKDTPLSDVLKSFYLCKQPTEELHIERGFLAPPNIDLLSLVDVFPVLSEGEEGKQEAEVSIHTATEEAMRVSD